MTIKHKCEDKTISNKATFETVRTSHIMKILIMMVMAGHIGMKQRFM